MKKSPDAFHVIVKPIGPVCNLDCTYCYYLDKKQLYPKKKSFCMPDEILDELTRQYIESQPDGIPELQFSWQGGEPTLLGIAFFQKALQLQKKYQRSGMRIQNTIQTNGTLLTQEWGQFFHDESFLVGISIDGPEDIHDRFRRNSSEEPSFKQAMYGLEILKKHQVEFNTLTVVNRINGDQPQRIYTFLKEIGSQYFQFIPIVERDRTQSITPESVGSRQWGRFLQGIFDLWLEMDIGEIFVQMFDVFLGLYMGLPSSLCVHAETCGRAVALEHNGDLYTCDHFVFQPYFLGNITQKSLPELLDGDFQTEFGQNKRNRLPRFCHRCPQVHVCHGGCPAHRFIKAPGGESGLNYLCEGYKLFFQHSYPYFRAMANSLQAGRLAKDFRMFIDNQEQSPASRPGRNAPCLCGSGEKYKNCCGA